MLSVRRVEAARQSLVREARSQGGADNPGEDIRLICSRDWNPPGLPWQLRARSERITMVAVSALRSSTGFPGGH